MTVAFVSWPSAPLTHRLVISALRKIQREIEIVNSLGKNQYDSLIQWSTYDEIDHELTNARRESVLASSYTFRKAIIILHIRYMPTSLKIRLPSSRKLLLRHII